MDNCLIMPSIRLFVVRDVGVVQRDGMDIVLDYRLLVPLFILYVCIILYDDVTALYCNKVFAIEAVLFFANELLFAMGD